MAGVELVSAAALVSTHAGVEPQCLAWDRRGGPLADSSVAEARADVRDARRAQVRAAQMARCEEAAQVLSLNAEAGLIPERGTRLFRLACSG
jgi:hypothetical protein